MNATLPDLTLDVYAEEIALGASPTDATLIAQFVRCSSGYRAAWLAERAERQRGREEQEEALLKKLSYPGNPSLEEL